MLLRDLVIFIAEGPKKAGEGPGWGFILLRSPTGDQFFVVLFTIGAASCCGAHILGPLFCVKAYSMVGFQTWFIQFYPSFISFTLQNGVIQLRRCVTLSVKVRDPFLSFISNHINLMGPPSHFLLLRVIDRTNYLTVENTDYNTFGKLLNHR